MSYDAGETSRGAESSAVTRPTAFRGRARLLLGVLAMIAAAQSADLARGAGPSYRPPIDALIAPGGSARWPVTAGDRMRQARQGTDPRDARPDRIARPGRAPAPANSAPLEGARLVPADVSRYSDGIGFYEPAALRTIFIDFVRPDWEQQLAARYRTGVDMPATVTIDGKVYKDVGVRFRGNSSFRQVPAGYKRSLNVSLDAVHAEQEVGGYRTLNLLNANGDPTFVRTVLYSAIARRYGPAPQANFVRVVINGESWGVYVNLQQFNKDFARDAFGTTKGARWKVPGSPRGRAGLEYMGDSPDLYKSVYEIKSKDDAKSWADLIRLCRLLNTTPPEQIEAVLAAHLDIDGVLRFLAVDVALVNSDGYWTRASDYSIYQDVSGRFHIIPYDFNESLGPSGGPGRRGGGFGSGPDIDPLVGREDPSKPLRSKLLAVPALRAKYLTYVADIAENGLDWRTLEPRVRRYQELIEEDVKADTRKLYSYEAFDTAVLQRFVEARRAFLLNALAAAGR
jgi:hypothetical protein